MHEWTRIFHPLLELPRDRNELASSEDEDDLELGLPSHAPASTRIEVTEASESEPKAQVVAVESETSGRSISRRPR